MSDGERVDFTLRELLPHLEAPGLLPIPQRVWQHLQPSDRLDLHKLAVEKQLYLFGRKMTLPNKDEVMVWIESVVRPNLIETCGKEEHLAQLLIGKENDEPIAQTMAIYVAAVLFDLAEYDDYETLPTRMEHMTEPQLGEHLSRQLRFIQGCETEDTIGSMLIVFQEDNITQYGSTVDPETAPDALRDLADRIERRETVKRGQ